MIDWGKCFGFDLETHGDKKEYALQAYRLTTGQAKIKAASVCNSKGQGYSVLNPEHAKIGNFLSMVAGKDGYVVGWNVTFDAAWCVAAGLEKEVFAVKWLDGMLLWRHAVVEPEGDNIPRGKRKSYSLESAMKEFYPEHAGFKEFDDFQANDAESLELLKKRNVEDARWTLKLAHRFYHALSPAQQVAARIEARSIPLMAKTRVLGIYSSTDEAEDLGEFLKREAVSIYRQLLETSPEVRGMNLNSTQQLQDLIYNTWGLPASRFSSRTGSPSTDKYALFDLAALDPRAALLKKLREYKNNRTKYAQGTLKSLEYNGDGYVRPQGKIFSTYTSRITYGSSDEAEVEVVKTTKAKGTVVTTKKAQIPVGVALHQWKRGREYRRLIKPPPGYDLVELDAAGQEFRWMAVASEDETMLSLCAPGEDAHSYMGSKVARVDYRELIRLNKEGDPQAYLDRKCGKFCIAEGQLVLTDKGLIPIEKISLDYKVWDGVEFVHHEGLIYQGIKEVMTYDGLTATPDHKVYTEEEGKLRLDQAAEKGYRLVRSVHDRHSVWESFNLFDRGTEKRAETRYLCSVSLRLRTYTVGEYREPCVREVYSMQRLREQAEAQEGRSPYRRVISSWEAAKEMLGYAPEVREPERQGVQELRCERYNVQVCISCRGCEICNEAPPSSGLQVAGHRSHRQRRPLRERESEVIDPQSEPKEPKNISEVAGPQRKRGSVSTRIPCNQNSPSRDYVRSRDACCLCQKRTFTESNTGEMEDSKLQTKRVYDIANAGPRHRFTVSERLVANCNLSYQYRVSPKTATVKARVEYEMDVDELFINNTLSTYKQAYLGVENYWASQIRKCKSLGYAETFAGRRVQLLGSWAGKMRWPMESTSINYPIQGTGGDQKYLALAVARGLLPKYNGYFYYELHDGLFFIFPHDKTIKAAIEFNDVLSNLPYKQAWGIDLPIKFPFDCKIGTSWGELKDLDKFL